MAPPPDLERLLLQMQFPGMPKPESDVAMLWLQRHGHEYDAVEFNVRLGDGTDPGAEFLPATRRQGVLVTQKRADVIAWRDGQADILEVKIRAGLGAIGQLKGYSVLYQRAHPQEPPPRLFVVAVRADDDVRTVLQAEGIHLVLYERTHTTPADAGA